MTPNLNIQPDIKISLKQSFGIDSEMEVDAFSKKSEYVPEIDKNYKFDRDTTLAIISGFAFNKRVLVQGYHGTGKSTHIEQVAARLILIQGQFNLAAICSICVDFPVPWYPWIKTLLLKENPDKIANVVSLSNL